MRFKLKSLKTPFKTDIQFFALSDTFQNSFSHFNYFRRLQFFLGEIRNLETITLG